MAARTRPSHLDKFAYHFETISAVLAGVADLQHIIKETKDHLTPIAPLLQGRLLRLVLSLSKE